jgi:hypothetical protein
MKYGSLLLVVPFAISARAERQYAQGAKAMVTVEYPFQSALEEGHGAGRADDGSRDGAFEKILPS